MNGKSRARRKVDQGLSQKERLQYVEMLLETSQRMGSLDTLDAVFEALVKVSVKQTGAERGTLFLHDDNTRELYSRIAQGIGFHEIRIMDTDGIAGAVFQSGTSEIVNDPYDDDRFNQDIDTETGYLTESILCTTVRNAKGEIIGVVEVLNKKNSQFNESDMFLLEGLANQSAMTLESLQMVEHMEGKRQREIEFLNVVSEITSELELTRLLQRVIAETTRMLDAERSTLFINDEKTNELFSFVGEGLDSAEIRLPNHVGIAGTVFTSGDTVNIPYAYADLRFNPSFDKQTGFFTRSILCVPVVNKDGNIIGVTQVLNKKAGVFTDEDESRLKAFTAQIAIGLENAKLFNDVRIVKNYNESMLQSMSNGVITFDEDDLSRSCNGAGGKIIRKPIEDVVGMSPDDIFGDSNSWLLEKIARVKATREIDHASDAELKFGEELISANVTVMPLTSGDGEPIGTLVMIEDISNEKRAKSTLSRYMDPGLADQMLAENNQEQILGGNDKVATILFSDVRGFTTITEKLGAQATVELLNNYFELMVDCISEQGGMLDKFIGDAIMAAFGIPMAHDDDEDRALRAGINMIQSLWEWNTKRRSNGEIEIDMGLGINTDTIVAGNIGSKKRMDYTMIGDGVNLAARLESACKQYSARVLLSEYTVGKLKGVYRLRDIDKVVVKGKTEPVGVFECLDYHDDSSFPNIMEVLGNFNEAVKLYRKQDWEKAIHYFKEALKGNEADGLSQKYIERCELLKTQPPGEDWDGVWVMSSK